MLLKIDIKNLNGFYFRDEVNIMNSYQKSESEHKYTSTGH